jgi:RNA polymerase sigma-70 factor (ECF subfamily)
VGATHQALDTGNDPQGTTLGTLLYAGATKPPAAESAWVGLVRSIGAGDQDAFRDLYGRTHVIVYTLIVRIVRNTETAEELTLDVFHDVWRRAASYDEAGGTVVGWIMNQARSRAIDQTRFERRHKRVDPFPGSAEPESEVDAGREMDSEARGKQVRAAVADLAPPERSAIETAYFSDISYVETASRLREPPGTIKSRIRSGIEKLRRTLISDRNA